MRKEISRTRRAFMQTLSGLTAAAWGVRAAGVGMLFAPLQARAGTAEQRATAAFTLRNATALADRNAPIPQHATNGDEALYPHRIANFSKGLPHSRTGEVDLAAYNSLLTALSTGRPDDFENIPLGGTVHLVD